MDAITPPDVTSSVPFMPKSARKRWPVTNTDELARHIARQLPELTHRQVVAVLQVATTTIFESLETQAAMGYERPSVALRRFGAFQLRWYPSVRRRLLGGMTATIPGHWRVTFLLPKPRRLVMREWRRGSRVPGE